MLVRDGDAVSESQSRREDCSRREIRNVENVKSKNSKCHQKKSVLVPFFSPEREKGNPGLAFLARPLYGPQRVHGRSSSRVPP